MLSLTLLGYFSIIFLIACIAGILNYIGTRIVMRGSSVEEARTAPHVVLVFDAIKCFAFWLVLPLSVIFEVLVACRFLVISIIDAVFGYYEQAKNAEEELAKVINCWFSLKLLVTSIKAPIWVSVILIGLSFTPMMIFFYELGYGYLLAGG